MADKRYSLVLDTNVLVAAMRSRTGASAAVLAMISAGQVDLKMSVALALEYEGVLKREVHASAISASEVDDLVVFLCANSERCETLARAWPLSSDPEDELVVRIAIASGCDYLITHNVRHFRELGGLSIEVVTPRQFLEIFRSQS